jgi:hypothetical protein
MPFLLNFEHYPYILLNSLENENYDLTYDLLNYIKVYNKTNPDEFYILEDNISNIIYNTKDYPLRIIQLLIDFGFRVCTVDIYSSVSNSNIDTVSYIYNICHIDFPPNLMVHACNNSNLKMINFLHQSGLNFDTKCLEASCWRGSLDIVKFIVICKVEITEKCIFSILTEGYLDIFKYLFFKGLITFEDIDKTGNLVETNIIKFSLLFRSYSYMHKNRNKISKNTLSSYVVRRRSINKMRKLASEKLWRSPNGLMVLKNWDLIQKCNIDFYY